jgi:hypothetical protein
MPNILKATLALVAAIGAILLASSQISAQETALNITSATQVPGGEASAELTALSIPAPGLGAWTIDITYDPAVVTAVACTPESAELNVCNAAFSDDTVRVAGANGDGLQGDTLLASIVFECDNSDGVSDLTLSIRTLVDATVGDPQAIDATLQHGSITCASEEPPPSTPTETPTPDAGILPDSGTGGDFDGGGSLNWLVAALAAAGLVALAGAGTLRWRPAAASSDFAAGPASEASSAPNVGIADSGRQGVPSWLAAALAGAGLLAGFYALRQRKR